MENNKLSRREFMALSGGALVQIGLQGTFVKLSHAENVDLSSKLRPDGKLRIPPGQMAVESIRNMGGTQGPGLHPDWRLKITGEVQKPLSFTWNDVLALPQTDLVCDVHCVTGWTLLDSRWEGILLKDLMKAAGVKEKAQFVIFEAHAGYTTSIPISEAGKSNVMLAHSFNGGRLDEPHGAPLRGLVADRYFYKSAKWIEGIRFSIKDELGYWEKSGFSNSADPWTEDRYAE